MTYTQQVITLTIVSMVGAMALYKIIKDLTSYVATQKFIRRSEKVNKVYNDAMDSLKAEHKDAEPKDFLLAMSELAAKYMESDDYVMRRAGERIAAEAAMPTIVEILFGSMLDGLKKTTNVSNVTKVAKRAYKKRAKKVTKVKKDTGTEMVVGETKYQTIGSRIQSMIIEKNTSQTALAAKLGKHVTYINSIVKGRKIPSYEAIKSIAKALEVDVDTMLANTISPRRPRKTK